METQTQAEPVAAPTFPEGTKLREYETIYLCRPEMTDEAVDRLKERMRGIVAREGGKVIKFTIWGKKKTQFEIAKQNRAVYVHMLYLGGSKLVAEVERNLRMFDDVVRQQTIKLAEETDANRPVEQDVKLAGDVDQLDRPPREDRGERRDDADQADGGDEREEGESESA